MLAMPVMRVMLVMQVDARLVDPDRQVLHNLQLARVRSLLPLSTSDFQLPIVLALKNRRRPDRIHPATRDTTWFQKLVGPFRSLTPLRCLQPRIIWFLTTLADASLPSFMGRENASSVALRMAECLKAVSGTQKLKALLQIQFVRPLLLGDSHSNGHRPNTQTTPEVGVVHLEYTQLAPGGMSKGKQGSQVNPMTTNISSISVKRLGQQDSLKA